jgi:hypothetical protein
MNPLSGAAQVAGYQRAFEISAIITLAALLVSFAIPRHTGLAAKH